MYWCGRAAAGARRGIAQPAGARSFPKVCGACHPLETVTSQRRNRAQWQESIDQMIARGAKGTAEEFARCSITWPGVTDRRAPHGPLPGPAPEAGDAARRSRRVRR